MVGPALDALTLSQITQGDMISSIAVRRWAVLAGAQLHSSNYSMDLAGIILAIAQFDPPQSARSISSSERSSPASVS